MKPSRYEDIDTTYLQTTLKKMKVKKSLLETSASTVVQDMKEDIGNEVAPATASTLREKRRATMWKFVKEMVPLCCIYDVDFNNSVKEYEFECEEDLSVKVGFIPVDTLYNVERDKIDDHGYYYVLGSSDMTDMSKILLDMMK